MHFGFSMVFPLFPSILPVGIFKKSGGYHQAGSKRTHQHHFLRMSQPKKPTKYRKRRKEQKHTNISKQKQNKKKQTKERKHKKKQKKKNKTKKNRGNKTKQKKQSSPPPGPAISCAGSPKPWTWPKRPCSWRRRCRL